MNEGYNLYKFCIYIHLDNNCNSLKAFASFALLSGVTYSSSTQKRRDLRDDVHTHFVTLIVKLTIVGGWVKPLDDKRGKVGTIKSPKNLG